MPRISLCLIARDEEEFLAACLESAAEAVDEVVVVDTGSTDRTGEIARARGARVVEEPWADDFSRARNRALEEATGDWVLVLDADEVLAPGAARAIRAAVADDDLDCGLLPLVNASRLDAAPGEVVAGRARRDGPTLLPRLLRRTPDLRWEGVVHESIARWLVAPGRRCRRVDATIVHYGNVPELRDRRRKRERNIALLRRRVALAPRDPLARAYLAGELLHEDRVEEAEAHVERAWADLLDAPPTVPAVPVATLRAFLALGRGRLDRVLETVRAAEERGNRHPNLDLLAARALLRRGEAAALPEVEARLRRALAQDGRPTLHETLPGATSWAARSALAEAAMVRGRFAEAERGFRAALAEGPGDLLSRLGLAEALLFQGRPADALGALAPALEGGRADAWVLAAAAACALGRFGDAARFLGRARAEGPTVEPRREEWRAHADALLRARSVLSRIAGGRLPAPGDADALVAEGEAAFHAGDLGRAAACFLRAAASRPASAVAWRDLAAALVAAGARDEAARALDAGIACCPDDPELACERAALHLAAGAPELAADRLREALDRKPGARAPAEMLRELGIVGDRGPELLAVGIIDAAEAAASGLAVRPLQDDVIASLARLGESPPEVIRRLRPARVLVDPARTDADAWRAAAAALEDDPPPPAPLLTVVVPTRDRPRALRRLLDRLAVQDLHPALFEVIVVDDGSEEDLGGVLGEPRPYALEVLRNEPARGPAAARNRAVARARGRWIVIFNDDALPARDNLRRHLVAQAASRRPEAVLGTFDFTPELARTPMARALGRSGLLFEYHRMRPGALHGWWAFYTCNISVPRDELVAVGGFAEEDFPRAICEDVELGLRLERERGVRVRYVPEIRAWHDHDIDVDAFRRRAFRLGYYQRRIAERHGQPEMDWPLGGRDPSRPESWWRTRALAEESARILERNLPAARALARPAEHPDEDARRAGELEGRLRRIAIAEAVRGHVVAHLGGTDEPDPPRVRLADELTSVVIPNLDGMPHLAWTIDSLRRTADGPVEVIVVDNGSTDGSLEWLRAQPDLRVLEMGRNAGAVSARNAGLAVARGASIVLCDNDVLFAPGWREALLAHLEAWPDVGMVGPMTEAVVPGPQRFEPPVGARLEEVARALRERLAGRWTPTYRLILFCLVARREVLERVGGLDPAFDPWGFEDDDWTVRAARAGFSLRVARDVFVRHLGSRTAGRRPGLDYAALLRRNWERFKARHGIDPSLPYGVPYDTAAAARRPFDPARDRVPLPEPPADPPPVVLLGPPRPLPAGVPAPPRMASNRALEAPPRRAAGAAR